MNDNIAIKVDHVSKKYCKSLKLSMLYGIKDIGRNTLGLSSYSEKLRKGEFWAVDDVSFEVRKGETLGIIGPNGSGKTTLLKLLNGIFWPDKGKITIKGKAGALIEVGAGFHPLLTGRENVYINAAILGMTKEEVDEKFDDIIEFADIGDFIDTPVKFYSSGMFVRLGFAVAAHCKPDILLVDEVLAVGDLAFALKCHRKMSEFRQSGGTVVMVSHNIQAIRNMCKKALWLNRGKIKEIGEVHHVCDLYEADVVMNRKSGYDTIGSQLHYDPAVRILKVEFLDNNDQIFTNYKVGDYFKLRIHFACKRIVKNPIFTVSIFNSEGLTVSSNYSNFDGCGFTQIFGVGHIDFCLDKLAFKPSKYVCSVTFSEEEVSNVLDWHEKCYVFTVAGSSTNYGLINPFPKWSLKYNQGGR
ncbi:Vitamin B12 import ATP-binding protein BtuD [subsurface metagenome]